MITRRTTLALSWVVLALGPALALVRDMPRTSDDAAIYATQWQLDLLFFLVGAIGFACLFTPLTALTGLWFNARKGLAIGIATAGGAFGQGIVPYLGRFLITELGWRDAMLVLGAGFFVILIPLMFLLRPAPASVQPAGQAAAPWQAG